MSKFTDQLKVYAKELDTKFERIRATCSDSGVKGQNNEIIVADFLREYVPTYFMKTRVQILDSSDRISGEVDVCLCNREQMFSEAGAVFIAEGVDSVVQVKAMLSNTELERLKTNCVSVKQLERRFRKGDTTLVTPGMPDKLLSRIPYVAFCFSSELAPETIHKRLEEISSEVSFHEQLDSLFVLDRGLTFINCYDGSGAGWTTRKRAPYVGWLRLDTGDMTLVELVRYLSVQIPRFSRLSSSMLYYFPVTPTYPVDGRTE